MLAREDLLARLDNQLVALIVVLKCSSEPWV
jgi:hypothetical protein